MWVLVDRQGHDLSMAVLVEYVYDFCELKGESGALTWEYGHSELWSSYFCPVVFDGVYSGLSWDRIAVIQKMLFILWCKTA